MSSWTGDVDESDEGEDAAENGFAATLQSHVDDGVVKEIEELELVEGIDEVDDVSLLKTAYTQLAGNGHDEMRNIIEKRLHSLDAAIPQDKTEQASLDEVDDDEDDGDEESSEPAIESVEEMADESGTEDEETDESASLDSSGDSDGPPVPQSAITVNEAMEIDRRWKILVWGPPKLFKSHFCYTMPEPIAYIDLEGKADDIAHKFQGKDVQIWQPKNMEAEPDTKFRRSRKALDEALEWLDWHQEHNDVIGTIVVDSMTLLWEWAQIHHKLENYPMKDNEEVELSANFHSSQESDWAVIKEYHNGEFRDRITDSEYHFCWTAMERVSFEETLDGDGDNIQVMEPKGEPDNDYKADTVIRARKDREHGKVGDLVGSNFTDNVFVGLKKPTFPKVEDAIELIGQEEASGSRTRAEIAEEIDSVAVIDYDPQKYTNG